MQGTLMQGILSLNQQGTLMQGILSLNQQGTSYFTVLVRDYATLM